MPLLIQSNATRTVYRQTLPAELWVNVSRLVKRG